MRHRVVFGLRAGLVTLGRHLAASRGCVRIVGIEGSSRNPHLICVGRRGMGQVLLSTAHLGGRMRSVETDVGRLFGVGMPQEVAGNDDDEDHSNDAEPWVNVLLQTNHLLYDQDGYGGPMADG